jgi:hypothetical protein
MANPNPDKKHLIPFKKGADARRNTKGAPKKLPQLDVLLAEVLGEENNGISAGEAILLALRKKALAGDVRAIELLFDRAYGKSKQSTEITFTEQPLFPMLVDNEIIK